MATVRQLLDALVSGQATLADTVAAFQARPWPPPPAPPPETAAWGETDDVVAGDDEWATVDTDARLSTQQYSALAAAYRQATATGGGPR